MDPITPTTNVQNDTTFKANQTVPSSPMNGDDVAAVATDIAKSEPALMPEAPVEQETLQRQDYTPTPEMPVQSSRVEQPPVSAADSSTPSTGM